MDNHSLAQNQAVPCVLCNAPIGVSCLDWYAEKHDLPYLKIEDIADCKMQHMPPFIEMPVGMEVIVDEH